MNAVSTMVYFFVGYTLFWLIPTAYLFLLFKKVKNLEKKISKGEST